ncbi:MAG: hypothetical protein ACK5LS_05835, partial [Propioniciclava sp.]
FVLPTQQRFSTPEAHHAAGGPKKWNGQQGFYVYREDRLIQSGGWNRLRTQDEHTKLARIAIDVPREADELLAVNVSKMRVSLPEGIRPALRALVAGIVSDAQRHYRDGEDTAEVTVTDYRSSPHTEPASTISGQVTDELLAVLLPRSLVVEGLRGVLGRSEDDLRRAVNAVLAIAWDQQQVRTWGADADEI